jgi:hypothetical protein
MTGNGRLFPLSPKVGCFSGMNLPALKAKLDP